MNLAKLYNSYDILSEAKDKISEHDKEYKDAIAATTGGEKEKQLASQIISKFFKHFPALQDKAINAVFDLCEDDDMAIRIAAMKTLPSFCKEFNKYVGRVADILAQMLQLKDPQEYNVASSTLLQVLKDSPSTVIKTMFKLVNDKETDPSVREKIIKFLIQKVQKLDKTILTAEVQDSLMQDVKITVQDCSPSEFLLLMGYLVSSQQALTLTGKQEIFSIISDQIEITQPFEPIDGENVNTDRLIVCIKHILPLFSTKLESTKFVVYYTDQVLPRWDEIGNLISGSKYQLAIAQQLADMSAYCGTLDNPDVHIEHIFNTLKMYMPTPPEDSNVTLMPYLNFTMVESLLYSFHSLARQHPEFLTNDQSILKDFRSRLLYFSRGVQGCLKALGSRDKETVVSPEDKKVLETSPKLLNNINLMIKDLFYQPPSFKCKLTLSFKGEMKPPIIKVQSPDKAVVGTKRHAPIVYENNGSSHNKHGRLNRTVLNEKKIYTPPSGKFSQNFHNNDRNTRFKRGGSSRGMRSRGRGGYRK